MKTAMKPLFLATSFAIASMAGAMTTAHAAETAEKTMEATTIEGLSGNIGVVSQYIFRGGVENENPSVQGGLDWAADNGFYVGYWGSNIGYSDEDSNNAVENDFYLGWGGGDQFNWDIGFLYYAYLNLSDANTPELYGSIGWGPLSLGTTYTLDDSVWTNKGDMYWTLAAEGEVGSGFTLGAKGGWYSYEKNGEYINSTESSNFRDLDLYVSHGLGATGADMGLHYIVGGKDRDGNDLDDNMVLRLSFGF